jgi:dTDP-4-dehydrorhamnose reductase
MLVIGASGFLGMHTVHVASALDALEIIRGDRNTTTQPGSIPIDIVDASSVDHAFREVQPDLVLLLAAMSDIDRCELAPEQAFAINARGAEHVANACARQNARLLFTSSAAVFDGNKHGYCEEDVTSPLSVYGKTKAWAEGAVKALMPSAVILRIALVLGFARTTGRPSILDTLLAKWTAGEAIPLSAVEVRNPIDAPSLGRIVIGLLTNQGISGVYHMGASDGISRYELGKCLAVEAGFPEDLVHPQYNTVPGRAPRGRDHFLLTEKIRRVGNFEIPTSAQVIERCFG